MAAERLARAASLAHRLSSRASALPATKADAPGLKKAMGKLQAALLEADDELNTLASEESVSVRAQGTSDARRRADPWARQGPTCRRATSCANDMVCRPCVMLWALACRRSKSAQPPSRPLPSS